MGEIVRHPTSGEEIKIGVIDECFFSREDLLKIKELGYKGYYDGEYDDSLERMLNNPDTIYSFDKKYAGITDIIFNVPIPIESRTGFGTTEYSKHTLPTYPGIQHEPVFLYHNGIYNYKVECQEKNKTIIHAKAIGEQWVNDRRCTLFKCNCCHYARFGVDHTTAMLLRNLYPQYSEVLNSYGDKPFIEKSLIVGEHYKDLDLCETLEILAMDFIESDFVSLLGKIYDDTFQLCEKAILSRGYPTIHNFYYKSTKGFLDAAKFSACKDCGGEMSNDESQRNLGYCDACIENYELVNTKVSAVKEQFANC